MVYADQEMCRIIIRNLFMNAIMFTPRGGTIRLAANYADAMINISVSDTGVGISHNNLQKLFQVDKKFSTPGTDGEHGSGFGLIVSKILVEKLGGAIAVESEVGKGTTFIINLPKVPPAA